MQDLLKRGIAIHHSGILPLIKEVCQAVLCIPLTYGAVLVMWNVDLAGHSLFLSTDSRTPVSERLS